MKKMAQVSAKVGQEVVMKQMVGIDAFDNAMQS